MAFIIPSPFASAAEEWKETPATYATLTVECPFEVAILLAVVSVLSKSFVGIPSFRVPFDRFSLTSLQFKVLRYYSPVRTRCIIHPLVLHFRQHRRAVASAAFGICVCLTGCSGAFDGVSAPAAETAAPGISGTTYGGRQPIANSAISIYAAGLAGYGSPATSLATTTSKSDGSFNIPPGTYNCPSSGAPLYLVASGGNPGNSDTTNNPTGNNPDIELVAALGTCGLAEENASINVDEVSTIAAAFALNGFISPANFGTSSNLGVADAIGTSTENLTGFTNAFATVNTLINPTTGASPGLTANATVESSKMNALGDILATCVNTDPSTTTTCSTLFTNISPTGSPVAGNTFEAAYYLLTNPTSTNSSGSHLATVFSSIPTSPPYQPVPSGTPTDWTVAVNYQTPTLASAENVAVDASGNIWIDGDGNGGSIPASVVELSPTGGVLSTITSDGGTNHVNAPRQILLDLKGKAWVANSAANTLFEISGGAVSAVIPAPGTPWAMATDAQNNLWLSEVVAGSQVLAECPYDPVNNVSCTGLTSYSSIGTHTYGMAIDPNLGNIWLTNMASSTTGNIAQYQSSDGTKVATYYTSTTADAYYPLGIAFDSSNSIWFSNEGASGASFLTVASNPPGTNPIGTYSGGGLNAARYIAMDGSSNVWVANSASSSGSYSISEFSNSGTAISPAAGFVHNFSSPIAVAVDGSGNVWVANNSTAASYVTEVVGAATPVVTPLSVAVANSTVGSAPGAGGSPGGGGGGTSPGGLPVPTSGAYFGAWVNPMGSGATPAQVISQTATFESQIGRKLAIHLSYNGWSNSFPTSQISDDVTNNRVPLISMSCGMNNAATAAGGEDSNIIATANALKGLGIPVMLRWEWEFNLTSNNSACLLDPTKSSDPLSTQESDFIAAWKHIWTLFKQQGATNVIFVWNPSGGGVNPTPFYPGDTYVDWIGIDHYDQTASDASFSDVFSGPYSVNAVHNKPIIIGETGAYAANQGVFISQAESMIKTSQFSLIKAYCYFDAPGMTSQSYVLNTSTPGFTSITNLGADSYFGYYNP